MAAPARHTGRLVLAPRDPDAAPPLPPLIAGLGAIGLIGEPLDRADGPAFLIGPDLLGLITFMGCSPHVELAPPADGGPFCHVRILGPHPGPVLLHGRNTQPPRCRQCRRRLSDWQDRLDAWTRAPAQPAIRCPHCGTAQSPLDLGWRESAGFGRLFVTVEDVFPGEAVPVPSLLQALRAATGTDWHWFYVRV